MQVVVHPRAAVVLVDAHGPEAVQLDVVVGEQPVEFLQLLDGQARQLAAVFPGVGRKTFLVLLERDGRGVVDLRTDIGGVVAVVGGVADVLGALREGEVIAHPVRIVGLVFQQVVRDAVGDGQVPVGLHEEHLVGRRAGARAQRRDVVVLDLGVGDLARHHARVEHRMRLGHVGAPGDEHVREVDVAVATGRLVGAEHVHESHDGAGHAQARVRVDVVGQQARLPELRGAIALKDGLLAAAPERQARLVVFPGFPKLAGHQVERFIPFGLAEALVGALERVVVADERLGQAVLTGKDLAQVVALDAVQAAVRIVFRVAVDRDELAVAAFHDDAAATAAEAADRQRFRDGIAVVRLVHLCGASCHGKQRPARGGARHGDGRGLQECSARNVSHAHNPLFFLLLRSGAMPRPAEACHILVCASCSRSSSCSRLRFPLRKARRPILFPARRASRCGWERADRQPRIASRTARSRCTRPCSPWG